MFITAIIFIKVISLVCVTSDTFPSLLTTNATLAVVIDREYLAEKYEQIKDIVETFMVYAKRELLKHGGVNIKYFSWTSINVKRDITAIFSIASCKDTWSLYKSASEENILHLAISETDCPRMPTNEAFMVPLIQNGEEMPQILLDLRTSNVFQWESAAILFDLTLERDMVTRVVSALTKESEALKKNCAVSIIQLNTNGSVSENRAFIKETLHKISTKAVGKNFMPIVSMEVMEIIMDLTKDFGLIVPDNQWLFIVSDTNAKNDSSLKVKRFLKEGDNVAFIYNMTSSDISCNGGLECHTEEILEAFSRSLETAIVGEYELASQVSDEEWEAIRPTKLERRNSLLYNIKAHLLKAGTCDNCTTWKVQSGETWGKEFQLQSSNKSSPELVNVGTWRTSDGIAMTDELFLHVAHGFRGITLPLITFHNPPWQILKTNSSGSVTAEGLVFDIIKVLARSLNFTYTIDVFNVDTGRNYSKNSNSTLHDTFEMTELTTYSIPDKIVETVRSKRAAMGAVVFTVTEHSKTFINFTMPLTTQSYTFLVARPRELSRALLFMAPFTMDTWLCLVATIVTMGPVLYYIHRLSPVYEYRGIRKQGGLSSIENCIWYMYGALLQQGGMHLPQSDSARLIIGAWWLVVLVVATTYCGNLVAFLTFPKIDNPIATLDDLLEHEDTVSWSIAKGSFFEMSIKNSKESKYKHIYTAATSLSLDSKEMLPLIEEGKHVFIDWKIRLQYIMRKRYLVTDRCDLALGSDEFFDEQLALIVAQDTPYLKRINREIKHLHQNGLIDKWLKDYLPQKDKCFKAGQVAEVNNHTVNMDDMQGSFFVLFFGFIFAAIWICGEKMWFRYMSKKEKKIIQPYTT